MLQRSLLLFQYVAISSFRCTERDGNGNGTAKHGINMKNSSGGNMTSQTASSEITRGLSKSWSFLGPYYNTGPNSGDPKRDHNFDNPPYSESEPEPKTPETPADRARNLFSPINFWIITNKAGSVGCSFYGFRAQISQSFLQTRSTDRIPKTARNLTMTFIEPHDIPTNSGSLQQFQAEWGPGALTTPELRGLGVD